MPDSSLSRWLVLALTAGSAGAKAALVIHNFILNEEKNSKDFFTFEVRKTATRFGIKKSTLARGVQDLIRLGFLFCVEGDIGLPKIIQLKFREPLPLHKPRHRVSSETQPALFENSGSRKGLIALPVGRSKRDL